MLKIENQLGSITVSKEYLDKLIGATVTNCFGVVGMSSDAKQDFIGFISGDKDKIDKGVSIKKSKDFFSISLHIIVRYGTNINAITDSIKHKVKYVIENETGFTPDRIDVYIDGMQNP